MEVTEETPQFKDTSIKISTAKEPARPLLTRNV